MTSPTTLEKTLEIFKENITELSWSALSLSAVIWPQFVGFNIIFLSAFTACVAISAGVSFTSRNNEENASTEKMSLLQFMKELLYYTGSTPTFIAVSSLMCILSTVAPINLYFNNAMQAALTGGSLIAYREAAIIMLLWQAGFWVMRNITAKAESQNVGAIDGVLIMKLFTQKLKGLTTDQEKEQHENNIKNMPRADDITSNVYYFGQTILSAVLIIVSSIISVIQFKLPAALDTMKYTMIKRFFALSVFINLLSVWYSRVGVQNTFTEQRVAQQNISGALKSDAPEVALSSKYLFYRVLLNWAQAFQDMFQGLPKAVNDNNNLAILLIVMSIAPSFPLGAASVITVAQVVSLGAAMKSMLIESLVISRNIGSWTRANSTYDTINISNDTLKPAFLKGEIKTLYDDLDKNNEQSHHQLFKAQRPHWTKDLLDSSMVMTALVTSAQLLSTYLGMPFLEVSLSTGTLSLALAASILYGVIEYTNTHQEHAEAEKIDNDNAFDQAYRNNAQKSKRFSNVFCNTMVTLLSSRLLCMFAPFFGKSVMTVLSFGLTASAWPQVVISAVAVNLTMTLIITPNLVPRKGEQSTFLQDTFKSIPSIGGSIVTGISSIPALIVTAYQSTLSQLMTISNGKNQPASSSDVKKTTAPKQTPKSNPNSPYSLANFWSAANQATRSWLNFESFGIN